VTIPVPDLDDRDFADLVAAARQRIAQVAPEWSDLSVHDPGMIVVEAFAHLTDILLYRVNRVPEKLYAVYLNLLGSALRPPSAAETELEFTRTGRPDEHLVVPAGTRVTMASPVPGTAAPVFATLEELRLPAGTASARVTAADVILHEGVVIGTGTGLPGQVCTLPGAPVVAGPSLAIGIEVPSERHSASGAARSWEGRAFQICQEVDVLADADPELPAVRVDRAAGRVVFPWWDPDDPPQRLPQAPGPGAQIRAWYRTGGGERGNVAAHRLTVLRDPVPGVRVTNPNAATGGRELEALDIALRRAPQEYQTRDRAVTARDYELLAGKHAGVARAKALTRQEVWAFALPGEVEVVLVPHLAESPTGSASLDWIESHQREAVRTEVAQYLRARATVGAIPKVRWGRYKQVRVHARVVVRADEDPDAVAGRIRARLSDAISPVPKGEQALASGFGRALRISNLYRALEHAEPGVEYVEDVAVELERTPDTDARALVRAEGQPQTWFVGQRDTLFRTTNAGSGWEPCAVFEGAVVRTVTTYPEAPPGRAQLQSHPGLVAVATEVGDRSAIHVSHDLGESWQQVTELGFSIADLAWVERAGTPTLLMAGEKGLYELPLSPGATPVQNLVDPAAPDRGFYAVESFIDVRGQTGVVAAAEASAGVWLSPQGGLPQSYELVRDPGEDIRCLCLQYDGPAILLWVGRSVPEGEGAGCARVRIDELARTDVSVLRTRWQELLRGWTGGSCWSITVAGDMALAATHSGGVLRMDLQEAEPAWRAPDVNCGLPLRGRARLFQPVQAISRARYADGSDVILAAGPVGVLRSSDGALTWRSCSARTLRDVVTLPPTWLFCSGEHDIEVRRSDA
jgi:hypothetical protein